VTYYAAWEPVARFLPFPRSRKLGIQMNKGAKLYFDALNANGGVNGHQVELRTLDDGYEPDRCKANTDKFIKDDVFALLAYVGTPTCAAALPLVHEAKIPFFGPFTGAELLRHTGIERRTRQGRPWRCGQPGHAFPVCSDHTDHE